MKFKIIPIILSVASLVFADKMVVDTTMAAADKSDHLSYEDRGSFGPYIEFNSIKSKNVTYDYVVHGQDYKLSIDNSFIYGASGSLPLTEWFDIFIMAGYQYIGASHHPKNREKVEAEFAEVVEEWGEESAPYGKSDIDGRHQIHTALFQLGFDFAYPLIASYNYQFMLKPYIFGAGIFGKTFFSDDTKFLSPMLYGYAYGAGIRLAWHGMFLSGGVKNAHEYFHTNFEQKSSNEVEDDKFMLDFDTYFQPFVTLGITLF